MGGIQTVIKTSLVDQMAHKFASRKFHLPSHQKEAHINEIQGSAEESSAYAEAQVPIKNVNRLYY